MPDPRKGRWVPILLFGAVLAVPFAYFALRPTKVVPPKIAEPTLTVREGEAGKAGEVLVTAEALQLAEIKVEPAAAKQVAEKLSVSGNVQAGGDQLVKVTPRAPGKVVRLFAGPGDSVRAGQTLALLESTDLGHAQAAYRQAVARADAARINLDRQRQLAKLGQFGRPQVEDARTKSIESDRDIQTAERDLNEEQTKFAEAQSERRGLDGRVTQARAEFDVTKARFERAEALFKEEMIARQELERLGADYKKAAADVEVALAALAQGNARFDGAKRRVAAADNELKLARRRGEVVAQAAKREENIYKGQFHTNREVVDAEAALRLAQVEVQGAGDAVRLLGGQPGGGNTIALTTPISGKVQDRTATLGETIDPEHAAFTVVNLEQVWAQLAVPPRDLGSVRVGDAVELTSETAPGRTFRGTILTIGSRADETTRAVSVRTTLGNAKDSLWPGSYVQGHIVTDIRRERVVVPNGALQEHTGRPTLYVASGKPGVFEIRHVKLGVQVGEMREISDGLLPGERIAVSGTFYLKSEALKSSLSDGCCAPSGG